MSHAPTHERAALARAQLQAFRDLDRSSAWTKLTASPHRILQSRLLKPMRRWRRVSFRTPASLFWGERMTVLMPEGWPFVRFGRYDDDLTEFLIIYLTDGMSFIDVGAHFGYFSMLAAYLAGPSGQVHAFEPTPRTFAILQHNLEHRPNVHLNAAAVYSRTTTMALTDHGPALAGYNSVREPRLAPRDRTETTRRVVQVATTSLDDYTRDWGERPTLIKIDAESAEHEIVRGMRRTLDRLRPMLAVEVGDFELPGVPLSRDVLQQIVDAGYSLYRFAGGRLAAHALQARYEPETIIALPAH